jgi:hypothetical protein
MPNAILSSARSRRARRVKRGITDRRLRGCRQRFTLPPSSRDAGNRISLSGLRVFTETRNSDSNHGRLRNCACNPSRSTRFRHISPRPSSRHRSVIPRFASPAIARHERHLAALRAAARNGRTPSDRNECSGPKRSRLLIGTGNRGRRRRSGLLHGTSVVAPNGSGATADFPRPHGANGELTVFGRRSCATDLCNEGSFPYH